LRNDRGKLNADAQTDLDALITRITTVRAARAWAYKEPLWELLDRQQINVVRGIQHGCTCVERMKEVATFVRRHVEGIVARAQTRRTNGFLEALHGLFQAGKRKARGQGRFSTPRIVLFLIAGRLDFSKIDPRATYPTRNLKEP